MPKASMMRSRSAEPLPLVAVLTALPVEFKAVRSKLKNASVSPTPLGGIYTTGRFESSQHTWNVALSLIGAGNPGAAIAAGDAISELEPDIVVFLGIAGGLKDVELGDVAIASKVYGYERGKATAQGFVASPDVAASHSRLVTHFANVAMSNQWRSRIPHESREARIPSAVVAPIAAGEKVVKSEKSQVARDIRTHFPDAVAVEMEGLGILAAAAYRGHVPAIVIRGISDLLSDKSADHDAAWQPRASQNAAALLFQGLAELDEEWVHGYRTERFDAAALAPELSEQVFRRAGRMTIDPNLQWAVMSVINTIMPPAKKGPGPVEEVGLHGEVESFARAFDSWTEVTERSGSKVFKARKVAEGVDLGWMVVKVAAPGHEDRLRSEVDLSARVASPQVRGYFDLRRLELPDGTVGLAAMAPWRESDTLSERIWSKDLLSLAEARELWASLAKVVADLAQRGLVHGDIKPSNVVGEPGSWVLIDFGAAGPVGDVGYVVGTPLYMPPEAFERQRHPTSDVYSLALTVVASLTGAEGDAARAFAQTRTVGENERTPAADRELDVWPGAIEGLPKDWKRLLLDCLTIAEARPAPAELLRRIRSLTI